MTSTPVSLPDSLESRYAEVCDRIARAATKAGRRPDDVVLIAVTKHADPEQIRTMINLGHKDFGENRVQQLVQRAAIVDEYFARLKVLPNLRRAKEGAGLDQDNLFGVKPRPELLGAAAATGPSPVRWHMIGHLQRNKARKIIDFVRLVHSVDSLRLAEELQTVALKRDQTVEVLIQVNLSGEASKFGCPMPAAIPLAEQIETMVNVRIRGLMTIAALGADERETQSVFGRCRELFEEMRTRGIGEGRFNLLSMGMSGDFELAVREGANLVRVGSAIFGEGPAEPEELREEPSDGADDDGGSDASGESEQG